MIGVPRPTSLNQKIRKKLIISSLIGGLIKPIIMEIRIYVTDRVNYNSDSHLENGQWVNLEGIDIHDFINVLENVVKEKGLQHDKCMIAISEGFEGFESLVENFDICYNNSLEELLEYVDFVNDNQILFREADMEDSSEVLGIYNEYCDECRLNDDIIYDMESFDDMFTERTPTEIIDSVSESFRTHHEYFIFNSYGIAISLTDWNVVELFNEERETILKYKFENR